MSKWLKLSLLALFSLFLASSAFAQGSLYSNTAYRYTPAGIFPASTAIITLCTSAATGTPCTPKITVYSDSALSAPVANPLAVCSTSGQIGCIDGLGNFSFYVAQGSYLYTVTGAGLTAYGPIAFGVSCVAGVTCVSASANNNFTGINTFTNAGVFTNTQMNGGYLSTNINSVNIQTEFQFDQTAANFSTSAFTTAIATPSGATVHQIDGLESYVTSACNSLNRTVCNTGAAYFHGRAIATGAAVWGINPVVSDKVGTTNTNIIGSEVDAVVHGAPNYVVGYDAIICGGCGSDTTNGTVPGSAHAFHVAAVNGANIQWANGFILDRGSVSGNGLYLGGFSLSANTRSNWITFHAFDGGNVEKVTALFGDSSSNFDIATNSGSTYFFLNSGGGIALPGSISGTSTIAAVSLGGGALAYQAVAFASLGTPANGAHVFCSDCNIANPCTGGGTGAFGKRLNGVWVCN